MKTWFCQAVFGTFCLSGEGIFCVRINDSDSNWDEVMRMVMTMKIVRVRTVYVAIIWKYCRTRTLPSPDNRPIRCTSQYCFDS